MGSNVKKPCDGCPFIKGNNPYETPKRMRQLEKQVIEGKKRFCHQAGVNSMFGGHGNKCVGAERRAVPLAR